MNDSNLLCVRCKERPMAYPHSKNHWCKICVDEVRRANYNPHRVRDRNLRNNYRGFTSKDYDALLLKQNGVCAVCGEHQGKHLHVDHDHTTGNVRGLLCNDCNAALGHVHDDPVIIRKLLHYILEHSNEVETI